jgi:hypothetical protein
MHHFDAEVGVKPPFRKKMKIVYAMIENKDTASVYLLMLSNNKK